LGLRMKKVWGRVQKPEDHFQVRQGRAKKGVKTNFPEITVRRIGEKGNNAWNEKNESSTKKTWKGKNTEEKVGTHGRKPTLPKREKEGGGLPTKSMMRQDQKGKRQG